ELAWDWTGSERDEVSGDRIFSTSLGYHVRIESLYTGAIGAELVPCASARVRGRRPLGLLSPREALADHGGVGGASAVSVALAEDGLEEGPRSLGHGAASGQAYCKALWTFGPVAEDAPDGFRVQGWSAYVRGSFRRDDGPEKTFEA